MDICYASYSFADIFTSHEFDYFDDESFLLLGMQSHPNDILFRLFVILMALLLYYFNFDSLRHSDCILVRSRFKYFIDSCNIVSTGIPHTAIATFGIINYHVIHLSTRTDPRVPSQRINLVIFSSRSILFCLYSMIASFICCTISVAKLFLISCLALRRYLHPSNSNILVNLLSYRQLYRR